MASSRKRSTSTGRSAESPPSRPERAAARRRPERRAGERRHGVLEPLVVVDDLHRPPAEHVGRAHEHRVADPVDDGARLGEAASRAAGRLGDLEPGAQGAPLLAVLGQVDRRRARCRGRARPGARPASFSGVWPPRPTITPATPPPPARRSASTTSSTSSVGERLEVEAVGGVVVGRDGLGVAVDHHRLEARVAQREARVHAAVVELDALADAVRPRPEDDDPRPAPTGRTSSSSS